MSKENMIKVTDDCNKTFILDATKIISIVVTTEGSVMSFLKRKGKFIVNVRHKNYRDVEVMSKISFVKKHRALATSIRLQSLSIS
jgi:hypothetical protein